MTNLGDRYKPAHVTAALVFDAAESGFPVHVLRTYVFIKHNFILT
jgi:hypothetical protein